MKVNTKSGGGSAATSFGVNLHVLPIYYYRPLFYIKYSVIINIDFIIASTDQFVIVSIDHTDQSLSD